MLPVIMHHLLIITFVQTLDRVETKKLQNFVTISLYSYSKAIGGTKHGYNSAR